MLFQVTEFPRFQRKSKADGFVWMITFVVVVGVAIDIGLLVGIIISVLCIFCNSLKAHISILGNIPNTDLFLDIERFEKAVEIQGVKIFHYSGSINFATKTSFRNRLCEKLRINLLKELERVDNLSLKGKVFLSNLNLKLLILDFSALSSIDPSSIDMLTTLMIDFNKLNVEVNIAGCSSSLYETFIHNDFRFMKNLYPTIQDAICPI
jgi:solute carrier family 26, other